MLAPVEVACEVSANDNLGEEATPDFGLRPRQRFIEDVERAAWAGGNSPYIESLASLIDAKPEYPVALRLVKIVGWLADSSNGNHRHETAVAPTIRGVVASLRRFGEPGRRVSAAEAADMRYHAAHALSNFLQGPFDRMNVNNLVSYTGQLELLKYAWAHCVPGASDERMCAQLLFEDLNPDRFTEHGLASGHAVYRDSMAPDIVAVRPPTPFFPPLTLSFLTLWYLPRRTRSFTARAGCHKGPAPSSPPQEQETRKLLKREKTNPRRGKKK